MKKLIYTLVLVTFAATGFAQNRKAPKITDEQRAEKATAMLEKQLALTQDQKAKIKAVQLERIKRSEEFHKTEMEGRKRNLDERKAFMKAQQEKMDQILSSEQKEKLKSLRKNQNAKMIDKRKGSQKKHKGARPDRKIN